MTRTRTLHLILRYSDRLRSVNTIEEHTQILQKRGYVWWGKFGQAVATDISATIRDQIQQNRPTFVYLTEGRTITHRARVSDVKDGRYEDPERLAVPRYYRDERCAFWLRLTTLVKVSHAAIIQKLVQYKHPHEAPNLNSSRGVMYVSPGVAVLGPHKRTKVGSTSDDSLDFYDDDDHYNPEDL